MLPKVFIQFYKNLLVKAKHISAKDFEQMIYNEKNLKSNFFYVKAQGEELDKLLFNFRYLKEKLEKNQVTIFEINNQYGYMINVIFSNNAKTGREYEKWVRENTETGFLARFKFSSFIPFLFLDIQPTDSLFCQGQIDPSVVEIFSRILSKGCVFINEPDNKKGKENYNFGSNNICVLSYENPLEIPQINLFEKVICIAPSSEDGSIHDSLSNWSVSNAIQNNKKQKEYLKSSLKKLDVNGICVYATFSINPIENEAVVNSVISESNEEYSLVDCSSKFNEIKRLQGLTNWETDEFQMNSNNIDNILFCMRFYSYLIHSDSTFVAVIIRKTMNENTDAKMSINNTKHEEVLQKIVDNIIINFGFNANYFNDLSFEFLDSFKNTIFSISKYLKKVIDMKDNQTLKIIFMGSSSFFFNEKNYNSIPIPLVDGLPQAAKYPSKRVITIDFSCFAKLISSLKIPFEKFPVELQNYLKSIENGGLFIKVDTCDCIFGAYLDDNFVKLKMSSVKAQRLYSLVSYYTSCQKVAIGNQSFHKICKENIFYVDKTEFINLWWKEEDIVTLITRPRRFGKTLTLNMVKCFFSYEYKEEGEKLFRGTKIFKYQDMMQIQGTYPVIFLSFGKNKSQDIISIINSIKKEIATVFNSFQNVLFENIDKFNENEINFIKSIDFNMSNETAFIAINYLCMFLYRIFSKKVIVLLDEYDSPMLNFWFKHDIESLRCLASFIQSFFCSTFKENPFLERAIITGITQICKESFFSGFDNILVITTTSRFYSTIFGFTDAEVEQILKNYRLDYWKEEVRKWYKGYHFGNSKDIYNPWSITMFIKCLKKPTCYWVSTSDNEIVNNLIKNSSKSVIVGLINLLQGLDYEISFEEENSIFGLLVASGYLTIVGEYKNDFDDEIYLKLKIPNFEINEFFIRMIKNWFSSSSNSFPLYIHNFIECNIDNLNQDLNQIIMDCLSGFDSIEHFLNGLTLRMTIELKQDFDVISHNQTGIDRYEILLIPKNIHKNKGYIIEFKAQNKQTKGQNEPKKIELKKLALNALKQIEDNKYDDELIKKGIGQNRIIKYAMVFYDNNCLVVTNQIDTEKE